MIIKRNFHPARVWSYIRVPMCFAIVWSTAVWGIHTYVPAMPLSLHFAPIGVMGSALAIFIAFRNNSAYQRWWEARQLWAGVVNSSRVLARLIVTFTDGHSHQPHYEADRSQAFKEIMVKRCIAWVHALRLHLRGQNQFEELRPWLSSKEFAAAQQSHHIPNYLQLTMGQSIYQAMANGTLGGFDSFQMEGQLLALANYQGQAERIKETPLPRQYDFFTRVFVIIFAALLPFGLLSVLSPSADWLMIPLSVLLCGVFVVMERTGAANEDPFENHITDVPMSALCRTIERDLLGILGHTMLPKPLQPEEGYLY